MKHLLTLISWLLITAALHAQQYPAKPNPPRLVNDFAGLLTADQRQSLEYKLNAYHDSTSTEVTLVTLESIGGADPGDYATELGRQWGVGGKEFNNGVIILITTGGGQGQRHVFIAPGYGLEKAIPDYTAKEIVDNEMIPQLQAGNYYRAVNNAVDGIIRAAAGQYKGTGGSKGRGGGSSRFFIFIIIFIIILAISRRGGGGRGGGMMSRRGYRSGLPPIWMLPGIFGGGGSSGGGGWSGGGGGGGGGFGGFGGGSFGGGGAGGNW